MSFKKFITSRTKLRKAYEEGGFVLVLQVAGPDSTILYSWLQNIVSTETTIEDNRAEENAKDLFFVDDSIRADATYNLTNSTKTAVPHVMFVQNHFHETFCEIKGI